MKRETFGIQETDGKGVLAVTYLNALPKNQRMEIVEEMILEAAQSFNDPAVADLLRILKIFHHLELRGCMPSETEPREDTVLRQKTDRLFRNRLRKLWWQMPDSQLSSHMIPVDTWVLPKAKKQMLEEISLGWIPELTDDSKSIFRFFIAVFAPLSKDMPLRPEESPEEEQARGRKPYFHEQQKVVLDLIHQRTGKDFSVGLLEQWLQQPHVPAPIMEVLLKARARNGGVSLVMRDIHSYQILSGFKAEERSPEAIEFLKRLSESARDLDEGAKTIMAYMGVDWKDRLFAGPYDEPIGRLEVQYGVNFNIHFIAIPNKDLPPEDRDNFFNEVKSCMEMWQKQNTHHYQISCCLGNW